MISLDNSLMLAPADLILYNLECPLQPAPAG